MIALNKIDHPDADKVRIVHIINTLNYYVTGLLQMGNQVQANQQLCIANESSEIALICVLPRILQK